jgi:hypothetical protein
VFFVIFVVQASFFDTEAEAQLITGATV